MSLTKLTSSLVAFDNLEMLVEQIDNAMNLQNLKLWPPLLSLLTAPEPELRRYAVSVIGTAVQNNPKAQSHLFAFHGVEKLVQRLDDVYPVQTKTLFALGSELSNFPEGVRRFGEVGGWGKLRGVLDVEEGMECQRRVAFFFTNFLGEMEVLEGVRGEIVKNGFLGGFVDVLGRFEIYRQDGFLMEKVWSLWDWLMRLYKLLRC
jgi:hypothetical protein